MNHGLFLLLCLMHLPHLPLNSVLPATTPPLWRASGTSTWLWPIQLSVLPWLRSVDTGRFQSGFRGTRCPSLELPSHRPWGEERQLACGHIPL